MALKTSSLLGRILKNGGVFFHRNLVTKTGSPYRPKLSYDHRLGSTPFRYETYCDVLDRAVEVSPDKTAVVSCHQGISKTFQEFHKDVYNLASGFLSLGLEKGAKVAVLSPNNYEWVVSQYALAYSGFVTVSVNPSFVEPEICYALKKSNSEAVIIGESFKGNQFMRMLSNIVPGLDTFRKAKIRCEKLPNLKHVITIANDSKLEMISLKEISDQGTNRDLKLKLEKLRSNIQADDPVMLQFTSGTTGQPKAAVLTHFSIINNVDYLANCFNLTSKDSICLPVPLFHVFGNILGTTVMGTSQAKIVIPSPEFDPGKVLRAIDAEKCSIVYGTPTMFVDLLNHQEFPKYNFSSIRGGLMAASNCPTKLLESVHDRMNMKDICVAYGCTENSTMITFTDLKDPLEKRCSTVGRTVRHIETKIIDNKGKIVERGQVGELCARGFQVMLEYFEDDKKTKEVLGKDRWYKTGDLASMDEQGYIKIVGRIKDMIIRGGENIYPREIEELLHTHPSIAEAQIFGVPDERLGEIVCCWIKLKVHEFLTEADVRGFCAKSLAKFKVPKHIRFVRDFPKTESGKIIKSALTEIMNKNLKLSKPENEKIAF